MRRAIRSLQWIVGTLVILVVLYVTWRLYENHEGAMEWQRSFADLKQRGEPSDATELIPPAVPDADNAPENEDQYGQPDCPADVEHGEKDFEHNAE